MTSSCQAENNNGRYDEEHEPCEVTAETLTLEIEIVQPEMTQKDQIELVYLLVDFDFFNKPKLEHELLFFDYHRKQISDF